jgi:hypothetical protein
MAFTGSPGIRWIIMKMMLTAASRVRAPTNRRRTM